MPIYEYRCSSCGHDVEALQRLADAPLLVCPACHAAALVKQMSASAFQLKGSGWYATDFKGGAKPATKPADDTKPAADSASDAKSESTPVAKPDAKDGKRVKTEKKTESPRRQPPAAFQRHHALTVPANRAI
jgi:putative FmdB family regulatory protein